MDEEEEDEGGAEVNGGGALTKQTNSKNTNAKLKHEDLTALMNEKARLRCGSKKCSKKRVAEEVS